MSIKYRGVGVVWGNALTAMTGLMGVGTYKPQSMNIDRSAKKAEVADANKETCGLVYYDGLKKLSIDVTPVGATLAAAKTNGSLSVEIGTLVTLVDAEDADVNGIWILETSSKAKSGEAWQLKFDLIQHADANVQVAIT